MLSDHTTTLPPLPVLPRADRTAPASTVVVCALASSSVSSFTATSPPPPRSPPTSILPPVVPSALSFAGDLIVVVGAVTAIVPPLPSAFIAVTSPPTSAVPPEVSQTWPSMVEVPVAWIAPDLPASA